VTAKGISLDSMLGVSETFSIFPTVIWITDAGK